MRSIYLFILNLLFRGISWQFLELIYLMKIILRHSADVCIGIEHFSILNCQQCYVRRSSSNFKNLKIKPNWTQFITNFCHFPSYRFIQCVQVLCNSLIHSLIKSLLWQLNATLFNENFSLKFFSNENTWYSHQEIVPLVIPLSGTAYHRFTDCSIKVY